jgi:hypothetical protein
MRITFNWTSKGYSRPPVGLGSLHPHLGHPRVTVARQSDSALFTLILDIQGLYTVARQSDWALFTLILDIQGLQSPASRTGLSSPSSWTSKGYSRPPAGIGSLHPHLGHPRVTVARQSDSALFTLILDIQRLQSPASRTGLSSPSSWTSKGNSRPPVGLGSLHPHLGHPRVTVARQSDWALFTLILDIQGLQSPASRTRLSSPSSWTPKGYSRPPVRLGSLQPWS